MNFKDNPAINSEKSRTRSFIFSKSHKTSIQLFKYGFVGGIAFCVDFGSLFFLTEVIKIHYLISAAIAFILGLLTNYTLSILWVFPKRAIADKRVEFLLFLIIGLVGLGLNEVIIWFFTEFIHFYYLISKLFSTVVVFFWNFFARKKILFS
ncbi:MAG: GtrA family protein [Candidatus Aminicenantes bacterium]|nr:GtrA family protein [Candidatus Aminicenantes bacterium]